MRFPWPINTPLEVYEQVGAERFDPSSHRYQMPFFWKTLAVPATPSWLVLRSERITEQTFFRALLVCIIESSFALVCFLAVMLHYAIFLPWCDVYSKPLIVFYLTALQYAVFYSFKVSFFLFFSFFLCINEKSD